MKRPVPRTVPGWFKEIKLVIADARGAESFGDLIGQPVTDANLFHLAPLVCLKFRGGNLVGCWSSVPRSGHWRTGTGSAQSTWGGGTSQVLNRLHVHGSGFLRHLLHRLLGREPRPRTQHGHHLGRQPAGIVPYPTVYLGWDALVLASSGTALFSSPGSYRGVPVVTVLGTHRHPHRHPR